MAAIPIAIGLIFNAQGEILISQRHALAHLGGFWEFPGGKCEANETSQQALLRECREELNIIITHCQKFLAFEHDYGDRTVAITAWLVTEFSGEPEGREGQLCRWVKPEALNIDEFPAGNVELIKQIKTMNLWINTH